MTRSARDEAGEIETVGVIGRQLEEAVEKIIQAAIEDLPFPEASYEIAYDRCGGLDLLIGAAFSFPLQPIARHRLAVAIQKKEENRLGDKWQSCIKRKAGSTKAASFFLDSFNPSGLPEKTDVRSRRDAQTAVRFTGTRA